MGSPFLNFFQKDNDDIGSLVRSGMPVGGMYEIPSSVPANTWTRLLWAFDATKQAARNQLVIPALRADIISVMGSKLRIFGTGATDYIVTQYDAGANLVTLDREIDNYDALSNSIGVIVYPYMLLPLTLNYLNSSTDAIDIGITSDAESATPDATTITKMATLSAGDILFLPISEIYRVFFRLPTITSNVTNTLSWGEHAILTG